MYEYVETDARDSQTYAAGWNAEKRARLVALWRRWHLNAMRASCVHQSSDAEFQARLKEQVTIRHWMLNTEAWVRRREIESRILEDARITTTICVALTEQAMLKLPLSITTYGDDDVLNDDYAKRYSLKSSEPKTLGWLRPDEHPRGCLTAKCATCGYAYGSGWLYEPLDVAAVNDIRELFNLDVDGLIAEATRPRTEASR